MYTWMAGIALLLLCLVARADEGTDSLGLHAAADNSLQTVFSQSSAVPVAAAPGASYYGGSEDSLRILAAPRQQLATFRDHIYNALGISHLIPRGSFMAGGMQTEW